jgi:hypothetical protein
MTTYLVTATTTAGEFERLVNATSLDQAMELAGTPIDATLIYMHAKEANYVATAGVDY